VKVSFTREQVELLLDVLAYARADMVNISNLDSGIARLTKRYCARRVAEIIAKLSPEEPPQ
jgi:hypothetical protein